jgi:hypothetical protein
LHLTSLEVSTVPYWLVALQVYTPESSGYMYRISRETKPNSWLGLYLCPVTQRLILTLYSIYTHFITCATSVDPDQPACPCCLIRNCTVRFLVRNNVINKKANIADPNQTSQMCQLIWIYTVCPHHKGVLYIWKKGLSQ